MARLLQEPKEEHLAYLRELLVDRFQKPIVNTNDCKYLEDAIVVAIQQRLSVDTLARLIGIKKSKSSPSIFTLETCSVYVGYTSWEELVRSYLEQSELYQKALLFEIMEQPMPFEELKLRLEKYPKSDGLYETFNQIVLYKATQQDEVFFGRLFEIDFLFAYEELYKYAIYNSVHLLSILCAKNEWLRTIAIKHYANLPYRENYFVEWAVVPNRAYYLPLLEQYATYKKQDKGATIFYHLVLCTYHAEQHAWELFTTHFNTISRLVVDSYSMNNILKMRWFGVQLYYNHHHNELIRQETLLQKIMKSSFINHKDSGHRVSSIFMICTYLFRIEEYASIVVLYEEKTNRSSVVLGYWAELNYNQLKVYYAYALYKLNSIPTSKIVFKEVKPERFDLNFKQRMITVYKSLETLLN